MVGHGGSSAGSYLADPTSPIPASHCASIVVTSTLRVNMEVSSQLQYISLAVILQLCIGTVNGVVMSQEVSEQMIEIYSITGYHS